MKKFMRKNEKGITLVALVITIIILIILAAVSINAVMNDGLIKNAKEAAGKYEKAQEEEKTELGKLMQEIENQKGTWVQEETTITNKYDPNKSFSVGDEVTVEAEGIPDIKWLVYGVNENNRLELISTETRDTTIYSSDVIKYPVENGVVNLVSNSEFEKTMNTRVMEAFDFSSNSSVLHAHGSEGYNLIEIGTDTSPIVRYFSTKYSNIYGLSISLGAGYVEIMGSQFETAPEGAPDYVEDAFITRWLVLFDYESDPDYAAR